MSSVISLSEHNRFLNWRQLEGFMTGEWRRMARLNSRTKSTASQNITNTGYSVLIRTRAKRSGKKKHPEQELLITAC